MARGKGANRSGRHRDVTKGEAAAELARLITRAPSNKTRGLEGGHLVATYSLVVMDPKRDIAGYFTAGDFVKNKLEIVKEFKSAMNKSLQYVDAA
jgi:hypothetical protein